MSENKIYVGNLSYDVTEEALQTCFEKFGTIQEISLIRDKMTKRLKGFGFITFEDASSVQGAVEVDGDELLGRPMKVSVAKERERVGGRGGRGGRDSRDSRDSRGGRGGNWDDNRGNR